MATEPAMIADTTIESSEWRWVFIASALLMLAISLPFMLAYGAAAPGSQFMGVLNNPIDGASYQAKMFQGFAGTWLFHLPYTPEPHRGVFLFTFFLAMGHLARILGLPIILVFHAARLIGSLLMFVTIYLFVADWTGNVTQRRITWGIAIVGSGLGWLALALGRINPVPPDLLVLPEAFPLQAAYTNAHFPWVIALAAWMAHTLYTVALIETTRWPRLDLTTMGLALATLVLVSLSPFVLLPIGLGYVGILLVLWRRHRAFPRREIAWANLILIFGIPLAAYNAWAISPANPIFNEWMQQNVTPSPPIWDYLIAFGPLLLLASIGVWKSRHMLETKDIFLIIWILSSFMLAYAPIGLQRRFLTGISVPLAIYAGIGLWRVLIPATPERLRMPVTGATLSLISLTTILAIALPLVGVRDPDQGRYYYISRAEDETLSWLQVNASNDHVVLASPELSLFIPTRGVRVVYGHDFETLHAAERKKAVEDFYAGRDCSVVGRDGVTFIVVGPREEQLRGGSQMCSPGTNKVFTSSDGQIAIYKVAGK